MNLFYCKMGDQQLMGFRLLAFLLIHDSTCNFCISANKCATAMLYASVMYNHNNNHDGCSIDDRPTMNTCI